MGVYFDNVLSLGKDFLVPAGALRLVRAKNYEPELIYWDDGSVLSFMTAVDIEPTKNILVGGAVLQYGGFAVCKLPAGAVS